MVEIKIYKEDMFGQYILYDSIVYTDIKDCDFMLQFKLVIRKNGDVEKYQ